MIMRVEYTCNDCILQVTFNPQGTRVLTSSADRTLKLWDPLTGACKQTLEGHTDEIFTCAFNYEGDTIISGKLTFGTLWVDSYLETGRFILGNQGVSLSEDYAYSPRYLGNLFFI